ncbi:hypothetical protein LJD36_18385 [Bifidobacterium sp. MSK23_125]|nr:hypothetical protein [Bifidobacterium sp. MSK23_125]
MPLIPAIIMISTTIANIWLVKDTPAWEVVKEGANKFLI